MEIEEMRVIRRGANWVFVLPDFENLQVSPQVWTDDGDTDIDAIYEQLTNQRINIKNKALVSDYIYTESISLPYQNCIISVGEVKGHPVDTLYLKFGRNNDTALTILLRPDEMAAIAYCATGVLWSYLEERVEAK